MYTKFPTNGLITRLMPVPALLALIALSGCVTENGGPKPKHWDQTRRNATLQLAEENISAGQFARARGVLATFADSPDVEIQMTLARCDVEEGRYEEALSRLDAIVEKPKKSRFHWLRGVALEGIGRWDAAAEAYQEAFGIESSAQIFVAWMDALVLAGRTAEAEEILERERQRFPGQPVINLLAARLQEKDGRIEAAIYELNSALLAEPDSTAIRQRLATLLTRAERYDEAVKEWDRLIDRCDDESTRHAYRRQAACCLLAAGRYEEARRAYQVMVAAKPDDTAALLGLATACLKTEDVEGALSASLRVLQADRSNVEAAQLAGLCYRRLGEPGRAEELLSGHASGNASK